MYEIKNIKEVENEIASFNKEVKIVFVVKKQPFEKIKEFLEKYNELGFSEKIIIGENHVNEAKKLKKYLEENLSLELKDKVEWHLIGSLQKSNINRALRIFSVIQTVDSYELAREINKKIEDNNHNIKDVYLQINIGQEVAKSGIKPSFDLIKKECLKISELENLNLRGLMCIEPLFKENQKENSRNYFRKMKEIFDDLNKEGVGLDVLSMGMSNTYKTAIEEGSNMIRLGRKIFGEREE